MHWVVPTRTRRYFPAQSLPEELLLHIFNLGIAQNSFRSTRRFLVTVSTTCSRWRKLAVETRGLWTNIAFKQVDSKHSLSILRLFLERSRDAPINLAIACDNSLGIMDLHGVLFTHWRRVRTLAISTVGPILPFRPPYFLLTSLEYLQYHDGTISHRPLDLLIPNLSDAPSLLERLSLTGHRVDDMLLLALVPSNIRFLKIQGPRYTDRVLSFINACSAVESLSLEPSLELRGITCASLTSLTLIGPVTLTSLRADITAPNLQHLSVFCPLTDDITLLQFQQSASQTIFPSLRTLTMVHPNIVLVHSLVVQLVQNNPSIIAMHLGDLNDNTPAKTLRGIVSQSSTPLALPRGIADLLEPGAFSIFPSVSPGDALTPDDVPDLQFLRIEVGSHLFRDGSKLWNLVSVTERLLSTRDKLRIEWYCNDLGEDDPASVRWLESKLVEEVLELRDGPLGDRFCISLATNPISLENLYRVDGVGVATHDCIAPLQTWLNEDDKW